MLAWHNLIFLMPLGLGLLLALSTTFGAGAGGDLDVDVDVDVDADVDVDIDADPSDLEGPQAHTGIDGLRLLAAIGVGKAPFSIVVMVLCVSYGVVGMAAKLALLSTLGTVNATLVGMAAALVLAPLLTRLSARAFVRLLPPVESYARSHEALVGSLGEVELVLRPGESLVRVMDETGTLHKIRCRHDEGDLQRGATIVVVDHDGDNDTFGVEQLRL